MDKASTGLAMVLLLGIGAQWLAWRMRLPAILLLLFFGLFAGPITGWVDPEAIFGSSLLPIAAIAVGLILFEGGLSLHLRELVETRRDVVKLVTLGALVTWVTVSIAARYCLGFDWRLAALLGAILVVTGPTVIGPLLRHVRPTPAVSSVLKWEGIVIDPVGATLALLVFEGDPDRRR